MDLQYSHPLVSKIADRLYRPEHSVSNTLSDGTVRLSVYMML
jgi:hypothetical protein